MNRIFEFIPSPEEAVISRILVLVHQAMDQHLPTAGQANRQFTKTVFSEEGERTASLPAAVDDDDGTRQAQDGGAFGTLEITSPIGNPAIDGRRPDKAPFSPASSPLLRSSAQTQPVSEKSPSLRHVADTAADSEYAESTLGHTGTDARLTATDHRDDSPDWVTRITLVLLFAGLILLAYVLFA